MKTIAEIRCENARSLAIEGPSAFGKVITMTGQQVNQIIGPKPTRNIGPNLARRIEQAFGMERGWLDVVHTKEEEFVDSAIRGAKVPLSEEARELIQWVVRLDALGDPARVLFRSQIGVMAVAVSFSKAHDLFAGGDNLDKAEEFLAARYRELLEEGNATTQERSA